MKVAVTGAGGFLGWHTSVRLHSQGHQVLAITRDNWHLLQRILDEADALIHIAGVNRAASDAEVEHGNTKLADDIASALPDRGMRVVFANTVQAGNGTPYGTGKARAAEILAQAAADRGGECVDVRLPNIFGEHGRPRYNSFVATFVDACITKREPLIDDREISVLHAQDAAQALIDGLRTASRTLEPSGSPVGVRQIWDLLVEFAHHYSTGDFPDLGTALRVNLFNTYRSALFPTHYPIRLQPHADVRGVFVETVRAHGGEGQSSISTTLPGVTRGNHYHLRKIERFVVVSGSATIALRRMFDDDVVEFQVQGDTPVAVDMPTGWVHSITNTGNDVLVTQFWSHEIYRPSAPDTYYETVRKARED